MNILKQTLSTIPIIVQILDVSKELTFRVFAVGGTIRDIILYSDLPQKRLDIDLIVAGDILVFGKMLAKKTGGSFFLMDEKRKIARVVLRDQGTRTVTVDLSPLRGGSVVSDLKLRDFTINSIAVDLSLLQRQGSTFLIDPMNGISDLSKKIIRKNSEVIFADDPLRLIRAIRFETQLSCSVESKTESLLSENAGKISSVSGERIRDEIFTALQSGKGSYFFNRLKSTGILTSLFPEVGNMKRRDTGDLSLWNHLHHFMKQTESLFNETNPFFKEFQNQIVSLLEQKIEDKVRIGELVLLSIFVQAVEQNESRALKTVVTRLKLGRRSGKILKDLLGFRTHYVKASSTGGSDNKTLMFSFFKASREIGVIVALLTVAESRNGPTEACPDHVWKKAKTLIAYYYTEFTKFKPLLNGDDLKREFGLKPGPRYKMILDKVDELTAAGRLKNKKESLKHVEKYLKDKY